MKSKFVFALVALFTATVWAETTTYSLTQTTNDTVVIRFTNNFPDLKGVGTLEGRLGRKWVALDNFFTTQNVGSVELPLPADATNYSTYRLRAMSVAPGNAFSRLALAYGNITTVGGTGPEPSGTNLWLPQYEGAFATNVPLSSPRAAVADDQGNIYVVEPFTHSVLVIAKTNGRIYTAIGRLDQRDSGIIDLPTGGPSFPAVAPAPPEEFAFPVLKNPTGLYFSQAKGILYVLDSGNARVLKYRDGLVSKLFSEFAGGIPASLTNGGSLWVSGDEQEAYYTDGTVLKYWEAKNSEDGTGGAVVLATDFLNLTDVKVNPQGRTIVVDHGANRVYRVRNNGSYLEDVQAGTGRLRGPSSVEDARDAALPGPTSITYLPIGGYLISTDIAARAWYVDLEGGTAPLIFGRAPTDKKPGAHVGDGQWFRRGGRSPKVSSIQSINVAPNGDLILLEGGYVRKIEFLRAKP